MIPRKKPWTSVLTITSRNRCRPVRSLPGCGPYSSAQACADQAIAGAVASGVTAGGTASEPSTGVDFAFRRGAMAKILILEDSPDNMKLFRTLLVLKGHEVTGLAGGEGLLEVIGRTEPELVLMDIQLPGKDGYALL